MVVAVVVCHGAHHECDAVQSITLLVDAGANVNAENKVRHMMGIGNHSSPSIGGGIVMMVVIMLVVVVI